MAKRKLRGIGKLHKLGKSLGFLNSLYDVREAGKSFLVPLWRLENLALAWNLQEYERAVFDALARELAPHASPIALVDAGADVGAFSFKALIALPRITQILAFEPNPESFAVLQQNVERLDVEAKCYQSALADFHGWGALSKPDYDAMETGRYIEMSAEGLGVPVRELDEFISQIVAETVLIKADVEGGESALFRGAGQTLRAAKTPIVLFEANRNVHERTRIDPMEVVLALQITRPFRFSICEHPGLPIDWQKPFFSQAPPGTVFNILALPL